MGTAVIHFADKADIEIGTAKCGARIKGGTLHTSETGRVTCLKCDSSLAAAEPKTPGETADPAADEAEAGSTTADLVREIVAISRYLCDLAEEQGDAEASAFWAFIASKIQDGPAAHWKAVAADEQRAVQRLEGYAKAIDKKEGEFAEQAAKLRDELEGALGRAEHYRARSAMLAAAINELGHIVRHDSRL